MGNLVRFGSLIVVGVFFYFYFPHDAESWQEVFSFCAEAFDPSVPADRQVAVLLATVIVFVFPLIGSIAILKIGMHLGRLVDQDAS